MLLSEMYILTTFPLCLKVRTQIMLFIIVVTVLELEQTFFRIDLLKNPVFLIYIRELPAPLKYNRFYTIYIQYFFKF
jgi:hypothetical protein